MKWLLRFLWRQIKYALALGISLFGVYATLEYFHQFWIGSALAFLSVIIAGMWLMSFFSSETWTNNDDHPRRSRESPHETQQREFEEDMNRYQREEEDRDS